MENSISASTVYLSMCPTTIEHFFNHCLIGVLIGGGGGGTGVDTTVINTPPHCNVNIQCINNNDITSVHISTIVDFYHSQSGPVIIIVHQYITHQYAYH